MTSEGPRVTGFRPAPAFSPLQAIGAEVGDVLQSCNGEKGDLLARIAEAVAALQARREPITLEVSRNGKTVVLKRSEKLPEPSESE